MTSLPARLYDRVYCRQNRVRFEHWVVMLSVACYLLHLALVFLARSGPHFAILAAVAGKTYLSAIYTPFSFILFYEVLALIAAVLLGLIGPWGWIGVVPLAPPEK